MNIREWYGCAVPYTPSSEADSAFNDVLDLYRIALCKYIGVDAKNLIHWVELARKNDDTDIGKSMFVDWVESTGLSQLRDLASRSLPDELDLVPQLDFEKDILESELDMKYPEELRAALIRIVTDVWGKVASFEEKDAVESPVIKAKSPWDTPPWIDDGFKISAYQSILLTEPQYRAPLYIC